MIAGGSALVLFITLFLPWYKASFDDESETANAWGALDLIDIILLLIVLAVIALVVMRALNMQLNLPAPRSQIILGLGALALLLILFRLLVLPNEVTIEGQSGDVDDFEDAGGDFGRSWGIFLALLSAAAMTVGGWLMQSEPGGGGPAGPGPLGAGTGAGAPGAGAPPAGGPPPAGGAQPGGTPGPGGGGTAAAAAPAGAGGGQPAADWYPDPKGEARLRYWDGSQWTDQTSE